jgi:hypothetical protein
VQGAFGMHIKQLVDDATVSWWVVVVISMPITLIVLVTLAIGLKKFRGFKKRISDWKGYVRLPNWRLAAPSFPNWRLVRETVTDLEKAAMESLVPKQEVPSLAR